MLAKYKNVMASLHELNLVRTRKIITSRQKNTVSIAGKNLLNFCNNDYLGLATHAKVKEAFIKGVKKYGVGSGASAVVAGYFTPQFELEESFADFLGHERAILFNSGYQANLAVMTCLSKDCSAIITDKFCHASTIDGIKLSGKVHKRYKHNDVLHCESLLKQYTTSILVTESIFSVHGDLSPITQLSLLAKQYSAALIVDDAHGLGVLGNGRGVMHSLQPQEVACVVSPFGKAIGCCGAMVSGSQDLIEHLLQHARSYIYTTALPPAVTCALMAALEVLVDEQDRIQNLHEIIKFFITEAKKRSLPFVSFDPTPIKSMFVAENKIAMQVQQELLARGFMVACMRPPSVPRGQACIRISLNCNHTKDQITGLLGLLKEVYAKFKG